MLFEDEHCLAIVKPAGQFVQGSWAPSGESTLEQVVRRHLDSQDPGSVYLGIVHRLDRPVSGVLIWAKTCKGCATALLAVRATEGREGILGHRRGGRGGAAGVERPVPSRRDRGSPGTLDRLADRPGVVGSRPVSSAGIARAPASPPRGSVLAEAIQTPRGLPAGSVSGPRPVEPTSSACRRPREECPSWATRPTVPPGRFPEGSPCTPDPCACSIRSSRRHCPARGLAPGLGSRKGIILPDAQPDRNSA